VFFGLGVCIAYGVKLEPLLIGRDLLVRKSVSKIFYYWPVFFLKKKQKS